MIRVDAAALQARLPDRASWSPSGCSVLANDADLPGMFEPARLLTPAPERGRAAIGVVVGNGCITSLRPELPVGAVLMLDSSPPVHAWQRYSDAVLAAQPTPGDFLGYVASDERRPALGMGDNHPIETLLAAECRAIGNSHFLSSEHRYAVCREAAIATPLLHTTVDIADETAMAAVSAALTEADAQITYLHVTNVAEFVMGALPAYRAALRGLPVHPEAFISWSSGVRDTPEGRVVSAPFARWSIGMDHYLRDSDALLAPLQRFRSGLLAAFAQASPW